jgi:hypothetical protein
MSNFDFAALDDIGTSADALSATTTTGSLSSLRQMMMREPRGLVLTEYGDEGASLGDKIDDGVASVVAALLLFFACERSASDEKDDVFRTGGDEDVVVTVVVVVVVSR